MRLNLPRLSGYRKNISRTGIFFYRTEQSFAKLPLLVLIQLRAIAGQVKDVDRRLPLGIDQGYLDIAALPGQRQAQRMQQPGRILRDNLLQGEQHTTDGRILPYTVFIDPQLGRIGITEKEARQQGIKIRVAKMPMTSVARAREFGETRGLMKILVHPDSKQILGAAILGMEGALPSPKKCFSSRFSAPNWERLWPPSPRN